MKQAQIFIFSSWFIASAATLGSLFFSEVMELPPCNLCWYQRIAMYPLFFTFLTGSFQGARPTFYFSLPFVICGWLISLYHNLLHYEIVPENLAPCSEGISCATVYLDWLGFITIPLMSFTAFTILAILLFFLKKEIHHEK